MGFTKTASVESIGAFTLDENNDVRRTAAMLHSSEGGPRKTASYYLDGGRRVDVQGILNKVADKYAISNDPRDFVYEAIRANTTNVSNDNHDAFPRDELLRYDPRNKTAVYMTYVAKPHHVNHRTDNPKTARGVIIDAHYNDDTPAIPDCPTKGCGMRTAERENRDTTGIHCKKCGATVKDEFVEILVAIDAKKDPLFADAVRTGELRSGSMGCNCAYTTCSVCQNVARTAGEFCEHIRNKGTLWASGGRRGTDWRKISSLEAEREFELRGSKFALTDLVSLRAPGNRYVGALAGTDQPFIVVKAFENCGDVEYDEYSRVDLPADQKANQTEFFGRVAHHVPTPEELKQETEQLIARARRHKAAQMDPGAQPQWMAVRVDGGQPVAAESLDKALALTPAGPNSTVEVAPVGGTDVLQAQQEALGPNVQWKSLDDAGMAQQGDVTININDVPGQEPQINFEDGEPTGPQTIEDFTEDQFGPAPKTSPQDEELSPEELGVIPPGASADSDNRSASMSFREAYRDWKVQVSPSGNAQLVSPHGPVLLFKNAKAETGMSDDARLAFGQTIMDAVFEHGVTRAAIKHGGLLAAKVASVVDYCLDDMVQYSDKDTKSNVAGGGMRDMRSYSEGSSDTVQEQADRDMDMPQSPKVKDVREDRTPDMEGADNSAPDSAVGERGSDMRDAPSMKQRDVLQDEQHDHKDRVAAVGRRVARKTDTARKAWLVAGYDKQADSYTLTNTDLDSKIVGSAELEKMWRQLDKGPGEAERERRAAKFEDRLKKVYAARLEAAVADAKRAAFEDITRALRVAARRAALNLEVSPLKEEMGVVLANSKVVGHDVLTRQPLEFEPLAPDLAVHLVESAWEVAGAKEIDTLISRAAELLAKDSEYLKSAESDLSKMAHRIPPVTSAAVMNEISREAEVLRRQAASGNLELPAPAVESAPAPNGHDRRASIQKALGATLVASQRNQYRH